MIPEELKNMKKMSGKDRLGAERDSEYMGVEDIEPGTEPVVTISALYNGMITLSRGKEKHDVISFAEETVPGSIKQVRPLVVNATNRKTLRKLFKGVTAEILEGKKIKLYIDPTVRNPSTGEKDGGIRIRDYVPKTDSAAAKVIKCAQCGKPITAVGSYSAEDVAKMNKQRYGKEICAECSKKIRAEQEAAEKATAESANNALADALNAEAAE